jgi:hypothetical protein
MTSGDFWASGVASLSFSQNSMVESSLGEFDWSPSKWILSQPDLDGANISLFPFRFPFSLAYQKSFAFFKMLPCCIERHLKVYSYFMRSFSC